MMTVSDTWPWLAVAGLGAWHGLHPATGWMFSVALGVREQRKSAVYSSLAPIAAGHALSIVAVAAAVVAFGLVVDMHAIKWIAGGGLIAWALAQWLFGHHVRLDAPSSVGMLGLLCWSFVISTSHGTGLMLVPVVLPLCLSGTPAGDLLTTGSIPIALGALGLHLAALMVMTAISATMAYRLIGTRAVQQRTQGLGFDHVWTLALVAAGLMLWTTAIG